MHRNRGDIRLTDESPTPGYGAPNWSPDGARIVWSGPGSHGVDLRWRPANGSGAAEPLLEMPGTQFVSSISPDGLVLAFDDIPWGRGSRDIWMLPLGGEPSAFLAKSSSEFDAQFSPDGRVVAYVSDESGRDEIYIPSRVPERKLRYRRMVGPGQCGRVMRASSSTSRATG